MKNIFNVGDVLIIQEKFLNTWRGELIAQNCFKVGDVVEVLETKQHDYDTEQDFHGVTKIKNLVTCEIYHVRDKSGFWCFFHKYDLIHNRIIKR